MYNIKNLHPKRIFILSGIDSAQQKARNFLSGV
jgi:hypothetical protein